MPTILSELPKVERKGRAPKYNFDELFDGDNAVQLVRGEDFECSVRTMRHNLYRHSQTRGLKVKTVISSDDPENKISFQVVERTADTKAKTKTTKKATAKKS